MGAECICFFTVLETHVADNLYSTGRALFRLHRKMGTGGDLFCKEYFYRLFLYVHGRFKPFISLQDNAQHFGYGST